MLEISKAWNRCRATHESDHWGITNRSIPTSISRI